MEDLNNALNDLEDEKNKLLEEGIDLIEVENYFDSRRNEILADLKTRVKKYRNKIIGAMNKTSEKAKRKMVEYNREKVNDLEQLNKKNKGD